MNQEGVWGEGLRKFACYLMEPPVGFWAFQSPEPVTDTRGLLFQDTGAIWCTQSIHKTNKMRSQIWSFTL